MYIIIIIIRGRPALALALEEALSDRRRKKHSNKKLGRGYHTNPSDGTLTYSLHRITNDILQN